MNMRRATWAVWLILAACLHLFGNSPGTLTIALLSALYPAASIAAVHLGARRWQAEFTASAQENKTVAGTLRVSGGVLPIPCAKCRVTCENLLTGERTQQTLPFSVWRKRTLSFVVHAEHCGLLQLTLDAFCAFDRFRLTQKKLDFRMEQRLLISPTLFDVDVATDEALRAAPDSERFSLTHAGLDPSETYAIREYIPGDPIRSIHWKLSEKTEKLLVRELSRPVLSRVLLLLAGTASVPPAVAAAMVQTLLSVSYALAREGISHTLGWTDAQTGAPVRHDIRAQADVCARIDALLSGPIQRGVLMTVDELGAYAHVVAVCEEGADIALPGNVTRLPVGNEAASAQPIELIIR